MWEPDGSLRDIYFPRTELADWQQFVEVARTHAAKYTFDGQHEEMPPVAQVLADRTGSHLLSFSVEGVLVNCHFFGPEEIELDVEPKDVKEERQHVAMLRFIANLAIAIGKQALVTPENDPDAPYLTFNPHSRTWSVDG